jgi:hypothetical protein
MNTPSRLYTDETEPFPVAAAPPTGRDGGTTPLPRDQWRALGVLSFVLGAVLVGSLWRLLVYHVLPSDVQALLAIANRVGDASRVLDFAAPGFLLLGGIVCAAGAPNGRARGLAVAGALLAALSAAARIAALLVSRAILARGAVSEAGRSELQAIYVAAELTSGFAVATLVVAASAFGQRASALRRALALTVPILLGLLAPLLSYVLSLRTWDPDDTRSGLIADVIFYALPVVALVLAVQLVRDAAWGGPRRAWPRRHDALGWVLGALVVSAMVTLATSVFGVRAAIAETSLEPVFASAQFGGLLVAPLYLIGLTGLVRGPRGTPVPTLVACSALFLVGGWVASMLLVRWGLGHRTLYPLPVRDTDHLRTLLVVAPTLSYVGSLLFVGALAQVARRVGAYRGDAAASRTLTLMLASGAFVPLALWAISRSFAAPITIMTGLAVLVLGAVVLANLIAAIVHTRSRIAETERGVTADAAVS